MRDVFAALAADAGRAGAAAVTVLVMKELGGLMRFAARERLGRLRDWQPMGNWHPIRELHWAWRGVRGRGARAALIVSLVALALAGNGLMFAVADSVVFRPVPYSKAHEIVEIHSIRPGEPGDNFLTPALLDEWRKQTDLFASVQGYLRKNVFVLAEGRSELVDTADVTPGLIELLGAAPRWGRSLTDADARENAAIPSLISARLARRLYGAPEAAVGRTVETTAYPVLVVGVMGDEFLFPSWRYEIWRVLDPRGPLTDGFRGVTSIARTVPELSRHQLAMAMQQRSAAIATAAGTPRGYTGAPGPFFLSSDGPSRTRTMFLVLLGGAMCLLLTACANVASLELAGALRRARTSAVQMALGASRGVLARVALLEGALLIVAAAAVGGGLAWLSVAALTKMLPSRLMAGSVNAINVDARALVFMAAVAGLGWLLTSLPAVLFASRTTLLHLLKTEDRSSSASRAGALLRRGLTAVEIAIAVTLVVGALLYTRSYAALLGVDKGFDASNLVEISFTVPAEYYSAPGEIARFMDELVTRVRSVPGVVAAMVGGAPPSRGNSPSAVRLSIDGRPPAEETVSLGEARVSLDYFTVTRIPVRSGRTFVAPEASTNVIVTESFANRFWPDGQAVGRSFRLVRGGRSEAVPLRIIGVAADVRTDRPDAGAAGESRFHYYTAYQPAPPPTPPATSPAPRPRSSGGMYRVFGATARLDFPDRADAVLAAARAVDPRLHVTLEFVEDKYAAMFSDVQLATRVTNAFGALAFVVAVVGVYGVMAYLVAGRRREIGIRMALGADRRDVSRLVMASAVKLVVAGTVLGIAGALVLARWTSSQFYGVSPTDPLTYLGVAAAILVTAVIATWQPARQAARIDPALTLRTE
jgi:predicted permease